MDSRLGKKLYLLEFFILSGSTHHFRSDLSSLLFFLRWPVTELPSNRRKMLIPPGCLTLNCLFLSICTCLAASPETDCHNAFERRSELLGINGRKFVCTSKPKPRTPSGSVQDGFGMTKFATRGGNQHAIFG